MPEKTESQDSLTQFVKKRGDVSFMMIEDSEEEELVSSDDITVTGEEAESGGALDAAGVEQQKV